MREFSKSVMVSIVRQLLKSTSFFSALPAWIPVAWQHRFGNVLLQIHSRKQIIRTHLLLRTGSDYSSLVRQKGLEPPTLGTGIRCSIH